MFPTKVDCTVNVPFGSPLKWTTCKWVKSDKQPHFSVGLHQALEMAGRAYVWAFITTANVQFMSGHKKYRKMKIKY